LVLLQRILTDISFKLDYTLSGSLFNLQYNFKVT